MTRFPPYQRMALITNMNPKFMMAKFLAQVLCARYV